MRKRGWYGMAGVLSGLLAGCQAPETGAPLLIPPTQQSSPPAADAPLGMEPGVENRLGRQAVVTAHSNYGDADTTVRLVTYQSTADSHGVSSGGVANDGRVDWRSWGTTVEGRSIEVATLGQGAWKLLVVAGLRGDDRTSVAIVERWAEHLAASGALLGGATVTLVRDANPDGRARQQAANARGVDLDRNFSASNWRKLPSNGQWLSGRLPESEPETRALSDLIVQDRPHAVLVLEDTEARPVLLQLGEAAPWVSSLSYDTKLKVVSADDGRTSGSLASFAMDRKAAAVVLQLPRRESPETAWDRNRRALANFIQQQGEQGTKTSSQGSSQDAVASTTNPLGPNAPRLERRVVGRTVGDVGGTDRSQLAPTVQRPVLEPGVRILSADELQSAQSLVPVITPRARRAAEEPQAGTAAEQESRKPSGLLLAPLRRLPVVTTPQASPHQSRQQRATLGDAGAEPRGAELLNRGVPRAGTGWPQTPIPIYPRTKTP